MVKKVFFNTCIAVDLFDTDRFFTSKCEYQDKIGSISQKIWFASRCRSSKTFQNCVKRCQITYEKSVAHVDATRKFQKQTFKRTMLPTEPKAQDRMLAWTVYLVILALCSISV